MIIDQKPSFITMVIKHTSFIIFLKPELNFIFLFEKTLFTSKTPMTMSFVVIGVDILFLKEIIRRDSKFLI